MVIRGELDATKVLGIREGTEAELDALFDLVDEDRSNSITRDEWHEFVGHRKKDLLELYDKLHKTKMIGVEYTANVVIDLREGLSAFRQGVQKGWKIGEVCGTVMPTEPGSESFIHGHFSKIKSKDTDIIIKFDLPDGSSKTLTFESYVTRDDLKQVLQGSTLATMLGAKRGSEEDLDELFNTLDADHDNAIEKLEWKDFVTDRMKDLDDLYDKLHHTKMMGIEYTGNTVLDMHKGLRAEAQGVQKGWKVGEVNGTAMPVDEVFIHGFLGKIKEKDEPITVKFKLPDGSDKDLTFESYVTRADLKGALASARHLSVDAPAPPVAYTKAVEAAKRRGSLLD